MPVDLARLLANHPQSIDSPFVFTSPTGNREQNFLRRCKEIAIRAGLDASTFDLKTFRSTYGTSMLRSGFDVRTVQSYDGASHLAEIDYARDNSPLGSLIYTYDAAGRKTSVGGSFARTALPSALANASYNAANQVIQWGSSTLTYDANGNMLTDGTSAFSWNPRNQLVSISGASNAAFAYDSVGRRLAKVINSSQTNFLFDGGNIVQEQGPDGSAVANLLTGFGIDENFIRTDAAGTHAFLVDSLDSTIALADSDGTLSAQYTYDPFGTTLTSGSSLNAAQYTGRENDGTGLYYYRARYYNAALGRFISEDPTQLWSGDSNFYRYGFGDPIRYRDPNGTDPLLGVWIGAAAGAMYGGLGAFTSGGSIGAIAEGAAAGAGIGALAGAVDPTMGVGTLAMIGALSGYTGDVLGQLGRNNFGPGDVDQGEALGAALAGALGAGIGGGLQNLATAAGASELEGGIINAVVSNNLSFPLGTLLSGLLGHHGPRPNPPKPK